MRPLVISRYMNFRQTARTVSRNGTDKLTKSATGTWECRASFDLETQSEWVLASPYRALQSPSSSASPRLRVNLSVPMDLLCVSVQFVQTLSLIVRSDKTSE